MADLREILNTHALDQMSNVSRVLLILCHKLVAFLREKV